MKNYYTLLICFCFLLSIQANAQNTRKNNKTQTQAVIIDASGIDKMASELMANRTSPTSVATSELAIIKYIEFNELLEAESLKFPADELYNSNWDTISVNPFTKALIEFPESYTIDCSSFIIPIDNNIKITSKYGPRGRRMHRGIDLKVQIGDTIRAAFSGKIRIKSFERRGFGYYLVVRHPNGLETVYGHLSKFLVSENEIVHAGQAIGLGGNTGRSNGSHLHFETRFLGKDINPAEIIDFENGVPHKDEYVFHNIKINGKKTNIYSSSTDALATHKVIKGETLSQIARNYNTTVAELCRLNNLTVSSKLQIGQLISVRASKVTVEASSNDIQQSSTSKQITPPNNQQVKTTPTAQATSKKIEVTIKDEVKSDNITYHYIKSGDSLYFIAKKYGTTVDKLCELNNIKSNTILKIGQKLRCS